MQTVNARVTPPHGVSIVASAGSPVGAPSTLYTVPAGKVLHITAVWASLSQPNTTPAAGDVQVKTTPENGSAVAVFGVCASDNAGQNVSGGLTGLDIPVAAGSTVTAALTGAAGSRSLAGFIGWIEDAK